MSLIQDKLKAYKPNWETNKQGTGKVEGMPNQAFFYKPFDAVHKKRLINRESEKSGGVSESKMISV